jgi:hypothetical protein
MRPSYRANDKDPMGGFLFFSLLTQQFDQRLVKASKAIKSNDNPLTYAISSVYVILSTNIQLKLPEKDKPVETSDKEILLNYVSRGNELFLSANSFDQSLLDTLGITIRTDAIPGFFRGYENMKDTYTRLADITNTLTTTSNLYYYPFVSNISRYDTATTTVLGTNQKGEVNYIVTRYGKGKIYLHVEPAAFSNYSLLTKSNIQYYEKALSYLQNRPAGTVYISDKAIFSPQAAFDSLGIFWNNPPLLFVLLIACASMLLYIAFGSKRQRRLVPAMPANTNSTISFVHTIANLYLQKKDNRNIALKMISYFLDNVRNHYYLNTSALNPEFMQSLSRKSGIAEKRVEQLINKIADVNATDVITDTQLLDIHNRIQEFYKR